MLYFEIRHHIFTIKTTVASLLCHSSQESLYV